MCSKEGVPLESTNGTLALNLTRKRDTPRDRELNGEADSPRNVWVYFFPKNRNLPSNIQIIFKDQQHFTHNKGILTPGIKLKLRISSLKWYAQVQCAVHSRRSICVQSGSVFFNTGRRKASKQHKIAWRQVGEKNQMKYITFAHNSQTPFNQKIKGSTMQ